MHFDDSGLTVHNPALGSSHYDLKLVPAVIAGYAIIVVPSMVYTSPFEACLSGALRKDNPKLLMAASAFLLPVLPFMVSAFHRGMMEMTPFLYAAWLLAAGVGVGTCNELLK